MKEKLLVSACLLGRNCKYNGGNNYTPAVETLKERSPSCGFGAVYDGTFTGTVVPGNGVAAELLAENGVAVYGESRIQELLDRT